MTQEEKAEAYNKALKAANNELKCCGTFDCDAARLIFRLFPGLAEDENERIKKDVKRAISIALDYSYFDEETANNCLAWLERQRTSEEALQYVKDNHSPSEASDFQAAMNIAVAKAYDKGYNDGLEKQGSEPNWCHHKVDLSNCSEEYRKAYYDGWNNCNMQHSQCKSDGNDVVKCLINGMKFYYEDNEEAVWGTEKFSMKVKDILSWLEKQGEQILANSAQNCKDEQKPADKVEPRFKVKYAGSEYNVFEVKDIAGVTFYGIEDETNHIDYVRAENCERVDGYSIKENGSPYPTKPAVFSEQNPAWRETLESLRHKWSLGDSAEAKYKVEAFDELIEILKEEKQ